MAMGTAVYGECLRMGIPGLDRNCGEGPFPGKLILGDTR